MLNCSIIVNSELSNSVWLTVQRHYSTVLESRIKQQRGSKRIDELMILVLAWKFNFLSPPAPHICIVHCWMNAPHFINDLCIIISTLWLDLPTCDFVCHHTTTELNCSSCITFQPYQKCSYTRPVFSILSQLQTFIKYPFHLSSTQTFWEVYRWKYYINDGRGNSLEC